MRDERRERDVRTATFEIPGRLNDMNKYTRACRSNPFAGAKMKKDDQEKVGWCILAAKIKPFDGPVRIRYAFYEQPNRGKLRDKSNIASFAIKVIEDALQDTRVIRNDDWSTVVGYSTSFYRSDHPRIVVTIEEA